MTTLFIYCYSFILQHFKHWPRQYPIVAHAEAATTAAVILMSQLYNRPVHIAHVARKEEVSYFSCGIPRGLDRGHGEKNAPGRVTEGWEPRRPEIEKVLLVFFCIKKYKGGSVCKTFLRSLIFRF